MKLPARPSFRIQGALLLCWLGGACGDDGSARANADAADAAEAAPTDGGTPVPDAGHPLDTMRDASSGGTGSLGLRIATYNVADVRSAGLTRDDDPKLKRIAATIQRIRPDVLFLNEIAYDQEGAPDFAGGPAGRNAQRFADNYLLVSQGDGLDPLRYGALMRPSNTGLPSGLDLDRANGAVTAPGSGYGEDCWGYGDFPGQYALAVLVRADLTIRVDDVRTFQTFKWSAIPGALRPRIPATGEPWHSDEAWAELRLSSKTHMDVPVELPDGSVLHLLASHPTPPSFDGPEDRNGARNHDEIRFWAEYLRNSAFIVDDEGVHGGLAAGSRFVIAGDLNADPDEGDSLGDPMGTWLLNNPEINGSFTPRVSPESDESFGRADDDDDTASFGYRVDYVLPSADLAITGGAVERSAESSDHAMVWIDVRSPGAFVHEMERALAPGD
jgi:endonuclease/exonuclease/phosphatase family metal-dependent hydrolase